MKKDKDYQIDIIQKSLGPKHQDALWYGGRVAEIEYKGCRMKERMTKDQLVFNDDPHAVSKAYNDAPYLFPTYEELYKKLAEYERDEAYGRLKILPCPIGETVWTIEGDEYFGGDDYLAEGEVVSIEIYEHTMVLGIRLTGTGFERTVYLDDLSVTWFLNYDNAVEQLEERNRDAKNN